MANADRLNATSGDIVISIVRREGVVVGAEKNMNRKECAVEDGEQHLTAKRIIVVAR